MVEPAPLPTLVRIDELGGLGPDEAPSGFTDADALAVIAERNNVCRIEIGKLESLQAWVDQQVALSAKRAETAPSK